MDRITLHLNGCIANMNKEDFTVFLMAAGTIGLSAPAHAQADPAVPKGMYEMSRNVAGLTSHCVGKGFLKADSIKNARKMVALMARLPGVDTSRAMPARLRACAAR
ncbi:hypothetical protein ACU4GD_41185 [Cupriavidus basilensis]